MAFGLQYTVFETAADVAQGEPLNENVRSISGTSQQTAVMHAAGGNKRRRVRICVDTNCWVTWGENPTATTDGTSGRAMGTDVSTVEYFDIQADHKIATIART